MVWVIIEKWEIGWSWAAPSFFGICVWSKASGEIMKFAGHCMPTFEGNTDMKHYIDGMECELEAGELILDGVKKLGLDRDTLGVRPLAAMIGGEIYSLNYTPFRESNIQLLRYSDDMGRRVYDRTLLFIFIAAVRKLFQGARAIVKYSLGSGIYIHIEKEPRLCERDVLMLEAEMRRIVRLALPLVRKRLDINEALAYFEQDGQPDKAELLRWRKFTYFDVYELEGHMDYFYGEMAPSTDYMDVFHLTCLDDDSLALIRPRADVPDVPAEYVESPKLKAAFDRNEFWSAQMDCEYVNDINQKVQDGSINELIKINEALHERQYVSIADQIMERGAKIVMVSGPSSSGKTTSANRIAVQLRTLGHAPIMISLDNYYLDRDAIPVDENGEQDFEHIDTLDIPRFRQDMARIMQGEEVDLPLFDFASGKRAKECMRVRLKDGQCMIIEGIHGLNPVLIADGVDERAVFRVFVSALTTLNLDDHNRIRVTEMRLLRRMVRDFRTRGTSVERTLEMWDSVLRGETRWIYPYQENADVFFNSTLVYEAAVLRRYALPLLNAVRHNSLFYARSREIVKFLNYFLDVDVEREVPPTSVLREFIGGNTFYND